MPTPAEQLEAVLEEQHRKLSEVADGFVIIARVADETGAKDSYRYKTHGSSSESRGLIEMVRTFLDEDDRANYRKTMDGDEG